MGYMTPEIANINKREVRLGGRVLFLTKDPRLIRQQVEGQNLSWVPSNELLDGISTDGIIPNQACYTSRTTDQLSDYLLTGIPNSVIKKGDIKDGHFEAIIAGKSFGRGSSREHAQLALIGCGVNFVIAESFERIFHENCQNYGLITIEHSRNDLIRELLTRQSIPFDQFITGLNQLAKQIAIHGGLMEFTKARMEGTTTFALEDVASRPMTMVEKIIASHLVSSPLNEPSDGKYVKPGKTGFVRIDYGYGYELQTHVCIEGLKRTFGDDFVINNPQKFFFFDDHLALLQDNPNSAFFRDIQKDLATRSGATIYPHNSELGVEGICHTVMLEKYALPGQLIVGNDSHTCTLGSVGALAIGKGTSELASSFVTSDVAVNIPETIRFNLNNRLQPGATSKDLMLHILAMPQLRDSLIGSGKVFEYSGPALNTLSFDEQVVLTNMAIEGNAFTGIIEPNEQSIDFLARRMNLTRNQIDKMIIRSDPDAIFAAVFDIDLSQIEPMIALPGDPQRGVPLSWLHDTTPVNIAYIGSCTGGKLEDLERAAKILSGRQVAESTALYIQASSQSILRTAKSLGLINIFEKSGAKFLLPGCGACMNAGPGSSETEDQVTISDTNRNFYGRMGKGHTYLANVEVVAASAVKGRISSPLDL